MFCSDELNVLSDGGLCIHCDNLPISLSKYEFDYLSLDIGAGKATSAEPAASCLICNPPARSTDGNSPSEQESDILQNRLLCGSPKDDFKDTTQEASRKSTFLKTSLSTHGIMLQLGGKEFSCLGFYPEETLGPHSQDYILCQSLRLQYGTNFHSQILWPLPTRAVGLDAIAAVAALLSFHCVLSFCLRELFLRTGGEPATRQCPPIDLHQN